MNDERTEYLRLMDVQVCRDMEGTDCLANVPQTVLLKQNTQLMILHEESHEAPVKRWNNFTVRTTSGVFAVVGNCCVQGQLQLPPSAIDPVHALTNQLRSFFPVTQATIIGPDNNRMSTPVLFVNKRFLNCIYIGDNAVVEPGCAELESAAH